MVPENDLSPAARKVQRALRDRGFSLDVVELPDSTRTASEAARAIGCTVSQIAKSLVFRGTETDRAILVIASGPNRVDTSKVSRMAGEPVELADAAFVRRRTGFAIGGVPPVGHDEKLETFIDEDLLSHDTIWAAAGTPHAVFALRPSDLEGLTDGTVCVVKT